MEAIVINRKLNEKEERQVRSLAASGPEKKILRAIPAGKSSASFDSGIPELTPAEKKQINYDIFNKVLQFGEKNIDGKSLTDLMTFGKASVWHYHKFRIYFYLRNLYYEIGLVEKALRTYSRIYYYTDSAELSEYFSENNNVKVFPSGTSQGSSRSRAGKLPVIIKYLFFFLVRVFVALFRLYLLKRPKHIVIDHAIPQRCLNLNTLKPEMANYNLAYLFEKLEKDFVILDEADVPVAASRDFRIRGRRYLSGSNRIFGEYILLKGILSPHVRHLMKTHNRLLTSAYRSISSKTSGNFEKMAVKRLTSLHASTRFFLFRYFAYQRYFSKISILSVTSIDENSPRIKTILDAARSNDIPVFGIQHGTMHNLHPAYIYTPEDKERRMVPDVTFVWGEHWKEFLEKSGNYPESSLVITGQVRTDIIPALHKRGRKMGHPFPAGKKIVVFASQPQRDPKLRRQAALDVFNAVRENDMIHLVLKLHPAERNDVHYYRNIADEAGCRNYSVVLQYDLYLLISQCDVMVTCFSTVGAETVYFGKPLVILDHLKQDIQQYHREGIAYQAADESELREIIDKIIRGELKVDREAYRRYISRYACRIDGNAAGRIIGHIRKHSSGQDP